MLKKILAKINASLKYRILNVVLKEHERLLISSSDVNYLKSIGWIESFKKKLPVNILNEPVPWLTYPFIDFIDDRLKKDMNVLEFGSGNSSYYFSNKTNRVISIEHNQEWHSKANNNIRDNMEVVLVKEKDISNYCIIPKRFNIKFDLILIDGIDRVNCVKRCIEVLTNGGVIILDDSERSEYKEAFEFLAQRGFRKIDFWGIAPGIFFRRCTTIFYRDHNCIGV